jgi:hypothetical protein
METEQFARAHEPTIRLTFFLCVFAAVALWELVALRRTLTVSKILRRASNFGLVVVNTALLRLLLALAAAGIAVFGAANDWGLLNPGGATLGDNQLEFR